MPHKREASSLSDIERALQFEFEGDVDANTLSGLFMFRLTRIPEKGDTIVEQGFRFTVESMSERRVNVVKIEAMEPEEEEPEEIPDEEES